MSYKTHLLENKVPKKFEKNGVCVREKYFCQDGIYLLTPRDTIYMVLNDLIRTHPNK